MGCFNSSGFISKLPILVGDRVVCFIGLQNEYGIDGHELWYPDSVVAPFFLPVRGQYDDYGSIENVDDTPAKRFLEKYCDLDIESIMNAVERCLYGDTLQKNIDYWSKDGDSEESEKYKRLAKLFHDNTSVRPVLLFEHEDVYDNVTRDYFENTSGWPCTQPEDKVRLFFDAIEDYKKFYNEFKDKFDNDQVLMSYLGDDLPKIAYDRPTFNSRFFFCRNEDEEELRERGEELYEKHTEHYQLIYSDLHRTFTLLDDMSTLDLFEMYDTCREEIERFYKLWIVYAFSPMYFGFSKTAGEQNYNMDCMYRVTSVINDKASSMYKDYVKRYSSERE